jgi:hypothetical protein
MKLYTIEITFEDFALGIEQYEADSPEQAVEMFFSKAECLKDYNRKELLDVMKERLANKSGLMQIAGNMRGMWFINTAGEFLNFPNELQAIYGGRLIQTDQHAPSRSSND